MSGKICCEETSVPQELALNDRDMLNDILYNQKQITVNTITALTETSNKILHDEIEKIYEEVEELQRESFGDAVLRLCAKYEITPSSLQTQIAISKSQF